MISHQQFFNPYQQGIAQNQQYGRSFVSVRSEQEITGYPVAPGNVVTFKLEGQPLIIEKTQGFSQFEAPVYKRWRMIEEDVPIEQPAETPEYALREDIDRLEGEIAALKSQLQKRPIPKKKEAEDE